MKAKNTFALVLALSLIFPFAFTACSNEDDPNQEVLSTDELNYEAFVVGGSSFSASGVSYQAEKDKFKLYKLEEKTDPAIPQTATLTINGYTLEGTYSHSEKIFPHIFYKHIYYGEDRHYEFSLDDSGQLLTLFIFTNSGKIDANITKELTEEACLEIAKDFILNTVSAKVDLDDYTVSKVRDTSDRYTFEFVKHINGFATMDETRVGVLKNGSVYSYNATMFGKISADDMPELDREKITQTIENKLDTIYQDKRDNYAAIKYQEPELCFAFLDDGTPAVYCVVSVRFENGKGGSISNVVSMVITW